MTGDKEAIRWDSLVNKMSNARSKTVGNQETG